MSKIVFRIAQVVGVVVLGLIAVGLVVGLVQWVVVAAVVVAIPVGGWWLYTRLSGRGASKRAVPPNRRAVAGDDPESRRSALEGRAVLDAAGRCGWCGSETLHRDEFGFPATPLAYHRKEIDAML